MKVTTILKWYSFVSENRQKESQEQERERDEKKAQAGERETTEQPFAQEIGKIKFRAVAAVQNTVFIYFGKYFLIVAYR